MTGGESVYRGRHDSAVEQTVHFAGKIILRITIVESYGVKGGRLAVKTFDCAVKCGTVGGDIG